MAAPTPDAPAPRAQRAWRAACPHCGAPVDFASAASASAVCTYCRSTLLREGDALRRIGESAELFDDHSPLQLGASGVYQGVGFALVGRLQYRSADGVWNEWHLLFDDGPGASGRLKSAWLSEDNGAYVLAFDQPALSDPPQADQLFAGERRLVGPSVWTVASVVQASLSAAQGELPRPPRLGAQFAVADLRNERGELATLDWANPEQPEWSLGRSVTLAELKMRGLREGEAEKSLKGQALACPSCGAALQPTLATTQSLSCGQCKAVVDISQGAGADLAHYAQQNSGVGGLEPQIPLGRTGRLDLGPEGPLPWQVVGYQERCNVPDPGDEDDEQVFWREYLLYNRQAGFAFLVDTNEGWSWVKPLTGAPTVSGSKAQWADTRFGQKERYRAKTTWVQGEFYWRVQRDEVLWVTDYSGPKGEVLSREQSRKQGVDEVVWSWGKTLSADTVAQAFRIDPKDRAALRRDAAPLSNLGNSLGDLSSSSGPATLWVMIAVVVVVLLLLSRCGRDDCDDTRRTFGENSTEYQQCQRQSSSGGFRSSGGSFGGYSSGGGGHK